MGVGVTAADNKERRGSASRGERKVVKYRKSPTEAIAHLLSMTEKTTQQISGTQRKWGVLKVVL